MYVESIDGQQPGLISRIKVANYKLKFIFPKEVHMKISEMLQDDIGLVLPFYIEQYNVYEGNCWTEKTAGKRIRQLFSINDNYALIMKDCNNKAIGFVIGYFKQYGDLFAYTLEEIVISHNEQNKGYGSMLLVRA